MKTVHGLRAIALLALLHIHVAKGQAGVEKSIELHAGAVRMHLQLDPLRYSFEGETGTLLRSDAKGLLWDGEAVRAKAETPCTAEVCRLTVEGRTGHRGVLTVRLGAHRALLEMQTEDQGGKLEFRTGGLTPGYGLGDDSVTRNHLDTDISGFANDKLLADGGLVRFVSNFIIYPKRGVGLVLIDPNEKIVCSSADEIVQGVTHAQRHTEMNYFFGSPHDIYAEFLHVRNAAGYPVFAPKAAMFGLGWEAFGALGWMTTQDAVQKSVDRYRAEGYPLRWVVIGSGYWPKEMQFHETTSFGLFDHEKYPDPKALFQHFHEEQIKVLLGLRICFVVGGPFTDEGLKQGYFLLKDGKPELYHGDWPESPYYMLDAHNSTALKWYLNLVQRWTKFGVDGYKEDLYGYTVADMRDDKASPINDVLMKQGVYLVERTGYLGSNGDLIRINDFNYDQNQDRGPVNSLALAYSGVPLLYPTLVGGTFAESKFPTARTHVMQTYMMRIAQWAAVHPGMAMGEPPWSFPEPEVAKVMLIAAQLHGRLQPYFYSTARQFAGDGYPWPMAPLPIAYPEDAAVFGRENNHVRGYEWMIGDALLATPLYGDDYATATTRNIYLPRGQWMDYDSGKIYQGPTTLKSFEMPPEKTPLFVGGSGVVLEEVDGHTVARAYPIASNSQAQFYIDGIATPSTVKVNVRDWKNPRVIDITTKRPAKGAWVRYAYQFVLEKGHSYRLE
jgi:alpha-glucosidase (family GH31 glycosyl hydrolase)